MVARYRSIASLIVNTCYAPVTTQHAADLLAPVMLDVEEGVQVEDLAVLRPRHALEGLAVEEAV